MNEIIEILKTMPFSETIIFGAGFYGKILFHIALSAGIRIKYFVEENNQGERLIEGIAVKDIFDIVDEIDHINILIGIGSKRDDSRLKKLLSDLGIKENQCYWFDYWGKGKIDIFDGTLGYAVDYELEGYKVYGGALDDTEDSFVTKIVIYGGSTSEDLYSGYPCWGEELYERFKSCNNRSVKIYNGAIRGYTSREEFLKCGRDIVSLMPDLVICFDGFNDAICNTQEEVFKKGIVKNKHIEFEPPSEYLYNVLNSFVRNGCNSYHRAGFGLEASMKFAELWSVRMKMLSAICQSIGSKFLSILQPTSVIGNVIMSEYEKKYLKYHWGGDQVLQVFIELYNELIDQSKLNSCSYDLTKMFDGDENCYLDLVHYTSYGNKKISKFVADILLTQGYI